MMLLTKEILGRLPKLYATENDGHEAVVQVKFFTPDGSHTFYATEYDPVEGRFFGLVTDGYGSPELGYFLLAELEAARGPGLGLPIERDRYFKPTSLKVILDAGVA
jgi:hypothetical protein